MKQSAHFNRRLLLEDATRVSDGSGGFVEEWRVIGELWGALTPRSGLERNGEETRISSVAYSVIVRASAVGAPSRPCPNQRFRESGRVLRILSVADVDPGARFLECHVVEETAA